MRKLKSKGITLYHFFYSRWFLNFKKREKLQAWQQKKLHYFLRYILPKAAFYRSFQYGQLSDLPMMDKSLMMADFEARNTQGISGEEAMAVAREAEESRDFEPTLKRLTVGLSSGTSGKRGLFLVSNEERARWAGILLGKALPSRFVWQILAWWKPPLRIAFFLRANSNLYNTLNSRRIDFGFYDLLAGIDAQAEKLNQQFPDILVAPATVLQRLSQLAQSGILRIKPKHVVSVAEVLEPTVSALIEQAFSCKAHQLYQATEGFLAYTCKKGKLHLNESHIYIEKEWVDKEKTRFYPVITDFSRTTQLIVRYRLNDILRLAKTPCSCGKAETHIEAIEGRSDQILWLPNAKENQLMALFPDSVRREMMLVDPPLAEYSIVQTGMVWQVNFLSDVVDGDNVKKAIEKAIKNLCQQFAVQMPILCFGQWQAPAPGEKCRRLWCDTKPVLRS